MRPTLWYVVRPARTIVDKNSGLTLTHHKASVFAHQYSGWEDEYLPAFDLSGGTVLDVGAGCGETAYFYFRHGVKKVVAVECNWFDLRCLRANRKKFNWDLEIIGERFKLEHLENNQFNLCKMDIEGGEAALLSLERIDFPLILESHSEDISRQLTGKFPSLALKKRTVQGLDILSNC